MTAVFLGARRRRPMRRVRAARRNVAARRQWLVSSMRSHCAFTRFAVRASAHEAFRWFKRCNEMLKTPLRAMPLQLVLIKMGLVLASQSARASRSGICATPKLCETNQRSALPTRPEARAFVGISTHATHAASASRDYSPLMTNKFPDGTTERPKRRNRV